MQTKYNTARRAAEAGGGGTYTAKIFTPKSGLVMVGGGGFKFDLVPAFLLIFPQRKGV